MVRQRFAGLVTGPGPMGRAGWWAFVWSASALLLGMSPLRGQELNPEHPGRVHYLASCARCHGVDGGGGEGPVLARAALPRAPNDVALIRIMAEGISGTAMPESWWLSPEELLQVASYVRSLAPETGSATPLPGDPTRGRVVFETAGCDGCHTVGGFGTARGPDLSHVGVRRGHSFIRQSILEPDAVLPRGFSAMPSDFLDYLMIRIVDRQGNEFSGMRLNEDTYTIQLRTGRGQLLSFYKPELRELSKQFDASLMRSYEGRLSPSEIDDLVAYLVGLGVEPGGVS